MAQPINPNTFFENIHLTNQNSLTHLLDFDEEHSDLSNVLKTSFYYTDTEFIQEMNPDSCTIMSLNCQSLNSKFSEIKLLNLRSQYMFYASRKRGLKIAN